MFDELQYRWALRRFLKEYATVRRSYDETPNEPGPDGTNFPKYTAGKELTYQSVAIDAFRSKYLLEQAYRYHVPIPDKEEDWTQPRFASERMLTTAAAQKLRTDIRAEQKADWDYW